MSRRRKNKQPRKQSAYVTLVNPVYPDQSVQVLRKGRKNIRILLEAIGYRELEAGE